MRARLRFTGLALAISAVATAAAGDNADAQHVQFADPPRAVADFSLTDQRGHALALSKLRGRPVLVFFGFAHCPDICPAMLQTLKAAHASRDPGMRRARIVMISVDGERDTPAAMKAYLEPLSKDFIGLTGNAADVTRIATDFRAIFFKGPPLNAAGDYNMQHTSQIYLVDAQGRLRAMFFEPSVETLVTITRQIAEEKTS